MFMVEIVDTCLNQPLTLWNIISAKKGESLFLLVFVIWHLNYYLLVSNNEIPQN